MLFFGRRRAALPRVRRKISSKNTVSLSDKEDRAMDIREILSRRIAILDGAMGTMIQARELGEADYRGTQFLDHPKDLRLNNDVLNITQPQIIESIHREYLEAGADIIETNTFNSTAISMAEYGLENRIYELNKAGAEIARRTVERFMAENPGSPRFVASARAPRRRRGPITGRDHIRYAQRQSRAVCH